VEPRLSGQLASAEEDLKLDDNDIKKYLPLFSPQKKEASQAKQDQTER